MRNVVLGMNAHLQLKILTKLLILSVSWDIFGNLSTRVTALAFLFSSRKEEQKMSLVGLFREIARTPHR